MSNMDANYIMLMDELKTARICAGAKMEELCNENKYTQAYVFQAIRDSLAQNIDLLQSYNTLYGKLKEKNNIGALEQETCKDAISREELLKAIDTWDKFGYTARYGLERLDKDDKEYVPYIHYDDVIKCIKGMSSVKQESKTGHWIRWYEKKEYDRYTINIPHCKCSECGKEYDAHSSRFIKYCNECGAKMVEPQESEE